MSVEDLDLPVGTRIAGRYVIDRCVRRGPYVAVYAARAETSPTARFAARVVRLPGPGVDAVGVVNRELQRVAMLRQRAVPALVAVVREAAGLVIITERPDGASLREMIQKSGKLKSGEIGRLVTEVATVLDALHGASPPLMHRSLTPDNIAVADRMLRVWVEECGLAQALTSARVLPDGASMTAPMYRSPGELLGRSTPSSDVFVLASLAYECLTGRPAHEGATDVDTEALVLRGPRPSVKASRAAGAQEIDAVLHRAWSDDASYPTAGAFARELVRVLTANPSSRGMPAALPRPRPEAVEVAAKDDPRKQTLLGVAPSSADESADRSAMKSTLLGIGTPRSQQRTPAPPTARGSAPFGPPVAPPGTAAILAEPHEPGGDRLRSRRLSETTQRVEVPRIRPPGTEPIDASPMRARTPVVTVERPRPPASPAAPAAPSSVEMSALAATLPAGTVPITPPFISSISTQIGTAVPTPPRPSPQQPTPPQGTPTSPQAAPQAPLAIPQPSTPLPSRAVAPAPTEEPRVDAARPTTPEIAAPAPADDKISLEPSVPPGERLSDQSWGDVNASLGIGFEEGNDAPTARPPALDNASSDESVPLSDRPTPDASSPTFQPEDYGLPPTLPVATAAQAAPTASSEGFGVVTADTFDIVSDDDFAPVTVPARSDPPPLPDPGQSPPMPTLPVVPQPVTPLGVTVSSRPPPLPAVEPSIDAEDDFGVMESSPVPAVPAPVEPVEDAPPAHHFTPQPMPAPQVLRPSVPAWAPTVPPPPAPPLSSKRGFRIAVTMGVALFVATGVLAAGWLYGRSTDRRETDSQVSIVRRPPSQRPTLPAVAAQTDASTAARPTADAAIAQAADVRAAESDATALAVADASPAVDASTVANTAPDAGETVAAAPADAGTTVAQEGEPDAGESPATARRHRHPHSDDMDTLEEQLTPDVQACITDNHHRRHVHVAVRYEGATGRAVEVHVSSAFAEPPIGPCIENVIRAHPVEPFTATDYENHFSFESH
ncbi:MAG: protein kinase [Polyangiales bacterium]